MPLKMNSSNETPFVTINQTVEVISLEFERYLYAYSCVVILVLTVCSISLVLNSCILCSSRWMHRSRLTPTLRFIFSLSASDAFGSLVQMFHFTVHSLLPNTYGIELTSNNFCPFLAMEAIRLSILLISVLHLLALAINHYFGIVRPLHYAATITRKTTIFVLIVIWASPVGFNLIYFASVNGEGFQSVKCREHSFLSRKEFTTTYSSLYFVPFLLMTFIYGQIFLVVRRHQRGLLRVEENSAGENSRRPSETFRHYLKRSARRFTRDFGNSGALEERRCSSVTQMKKSIKAVVTTLLILGSYLMGWIPAVLSYCLVCEGCLYSAATMSRWTVLGIMGTVNVLVILKSCVNPVIYAVRIPEIRDALIMMKNHSCGRGVRGRRTYRSGTLDTTSSTRSTTLTKRFSRTSRNNFNTVYAKRYQQENANEMRRFDRAETPTVQI